MDVVKLPVDRSRKKKTLEKTTHLGHPAVRIAVLIATRPRATMRRIALRAGLRVKQVVPGRNSRFGMAITTVRHVFSLHRSAPKFNLRCWTPNLIPRLSCRRPGLLMPCLHWSCRNRRAAHLRPRLHLRFRFRGDWDSGFGKQSLPRQTPPFSRQGWPFANRDWPCLHPSHGKPLLYGFHAKH